MFTEELNRLPYLAAPKIILSNIEAFCQYNRKTSVAVHLLLLK
jgi:hypothetical protein